MDASSGVVATKFWVLLFSHIFIEPVVIVGFVGSVQTASPVQSQGFVHAPAEVRVALPRSAEEFVKPPALHGELNPTRCTRESSVTPHTGSHLPGGLTHSVGALKPVICVFPPPGGLYNSPPQVASPSYSTELKPGVPGC